MHIRQSYNDPSHHTLAGLAAFAALELPDGLARRLHSRTGQS